MRSVRFATFGVGVLGATALMLGAGAGCGGSGGGGSGGSGNTGSGGSGNTGGGSALAGRCTDLATRVGGFSVALIEESTLAGTTTPAHVSFGGGVRSGARPSDVWTQEGAAMGGCRLMVGPSYACTTDCPAMGKVCGGPNQCVDDPRFQDVGTITLSGVGPSAVTVMPVTPTSFQYTWSPPSGSGVAYPPFAPGANVTMTSSGGAVSALSFGGRGIEPLVAPTAAKTFTRGEAFTFTWTAPAQTGVTTIRAGMEIAHHGGVAARIECDLPDTGTATVPEPLLTALVDKGLFGWPELSITRATYDSTTTSVGCVDFGVVSAVQRPLVGCTAPGVCKKSCMSDDDCTAPQTCQMPSLVCGS